MSQFSDFNLSPQILRAIGEMGFETPSPIQAQALPLLLGERTDFLGLAGTGTGKTAAFSIPLLEKIDTRSRVVQALILCPTRELALQVAGQITLLGKHLGVRVASVYGGAPFGEQVRALKSGAQVVVGTPGRVIDHLERATLSLSAVETLILDEADEMFSMGFKDELDKIIADVSEEANTWLFSATMSPEVRRVVQSSLHDPKTVQVNRTAMLASGVEQYFYRCQEGEKPEMICKLIEAADDFYGLIFCQTKALVADLTRFMLDRGYKVDCLHGDMDQNSRERTMQAFRDKKLSVLICTDVAARGLDVKDITHVVNYSLPREMESYVHRIGRTARSGKTGIVMNLLTFSHRHLLGRIEQHTRVRMTEGFVPSKREIAAKKVARLLPTFADQPFASRVLEVMGEEFREQLATLTPEEVAARFIVMMMPDIFGGEESRKTKKTRTAAVAPVAPVAARPATPIAAPVVPAPIVAKAKTLIETEAPDSKTVVEEEIEVPANVSPVEAAQLVIDALADANAVVNDVVEDSAPVLAAETSNADDSAGPNEAPSVDIFGDEVIAKKKKTASVDQPPRARKKRIFNEEEIASMLEAEPTFGVVKSRPSTSRPERSAPRREGGFPRSQSQFRSGPRESLSENREGRFERREGGFSRGARTGGFDRSSGGFRPYGRPNDRQDFGSRPGERSPRASRPDVSAQAEASPRAPRSRTFEQRPAAPANFAKPPKHEAGPARAARVGETGGLNRRARRAMLFGRPLDGETTEKSTN